MHDIDESVGNLLRLSVAGRHCRCTLANFKIETCLAHSRHDKIIAVLFYLINFHLKTNCIKLLKSTGYVMHQQFNI